VLTSPGYDIKSIDERSLVYFSDNPHHLLEAYVENGGRALFMLDETLRIGRSEPAAENPDLTKVLEDWGKEMWTSNKHTPPEKKWAITFSVLVTLTLVVDKILASTYSVCETEIKKGADPRAERATFRDLVRLTEKELFDRCKEIFHTSFKTRKAGKEAYNPIRDGKGAFRGKAVNEGISRFVWDLDAVMRDFEPEIRSHRSSRAEGSSNERPYTNLGRLASVFLADFLDH